MRHGPGVGLSDQFVEVHPTLLAVDSKFLLQIVYGPSSEFAPCGHLSAHLSAYGLKHPATHDGLLVHVDAESSPLFTRHE